MINQSIKVKQNRLKHFLDIYLEQDGIFMIRMIANNTSDYVATDLIHHLCNFYLFNYHNIKCMCNNNMFFFCFKKGCQHAENYDKLFPKDPHNIPDIECPFDHKKIDTHKKDDPRDKHRDDHVENSHHGAIRKLANENKDYLSFRKIYNQNYRYMNQMSRDSADHHFSNDLLANNNYDFTPSTLNKRSIHFKEEDEDNHHVSNNNEDNSEKIDNIHNNDESVQLLNFALKKKDPSAPGTNV